MENRLRASVLAYFEAQHVLVFGGVLFRLHVCYIACVPTTRPLAAPYATVHSAVIGEFDEVADANKDLSRVRADPLKAVTH